MKIKKILLIAFFMLLGLFLVSCGKDDKPKEKLKIENISFSDQTFEYDGNEHFIYVDGTLPEGVSASYQGNAKIEVGTHKVTATLSGEGYETLTLKANLIIEAKTISGITFANKTVDYDGNPQSIHIEGTLPSGVSVSYQENEKVLPGTYSVKATLSGTGYETLVLNATNYLFMLVGDQTRVKVDVHINNFVYDALGVKLNDEQVQTLFTLVVKKLKIKYPNLTVGKLDHTIWLKYSSR